MRDCGEQRLASVGPKHGCSAAHGLERFSGTITISRFSRSETRGGGHHPNANANLGSGFCCAPGCRRWRRERDDSHDTNARMRAGIAT